MLRVEGLPCPGGTLTFEVAPGQCLGLWSHGADDLAPVSQMIAALRSAAPGRVAIDRWDSERDAAQFRAAVSVYLPKAADRRSTALEHVHAIARVRGSRDSAAAALRRLHISPDAPMASAAVRSGAALAAVLVSGAPVLVLHEPFTELSHDTRGSAIEWILALARTTTSIVVSGREERDLRAVSTLVIKVGATR